MQNSSFLKLLFLFLVSLDSISASKRLKRGDNLENYGNFALDSTEYENFATAPLSAPSTFETETYIFHPDFKSSESEEYAVKEYFGYLFLNDYLAASNMILYGRFALSDSDVVYNFVNKLLRAPQWNYNMIDILINQQPHVFTQNYYNGRSVYEGASEHVIKYIIDNYKHKYPDIIRKIKKAYADLARESIEYRDFATAPPPSPSTFESETYTFHPGSNSLMSNTNITTKSHPRRGCLKKIGSLRTANNVKFSNKNSEKVFKSVIPYDECAEREYFGYLLQNDYRAAANMILYRGFVLSDSDVVYNFVNELLRSPQCNYNMIDILIRQQPHVFTQNYYNGRSVYEGASEHVIKFILHKCKDTHPDIMRKLAEQRFS